MKIYNSLTRNKKDFVPIRKGRIGIYVCGPTVYDEPHIGHARASYIFEMVRAYFEYKGYKVKFVKNVTDVDDKIIARAKEELPDAEINEAVKKIAEKYTQRYYEDMDALGIRRATIAPCATGHISQMQEFIRRLIKKKYAYESDGNVYFEVRKFKDYGNLSHQNLEQMRDNVRIERDENKKNDLDFALWKKAKEGEPSWDSPWGPGRPGWHIECSVMSSIYLGNEFDIHAGGQDLIFPHHENEIAQSCAFSGKRFARIWMHNGLLTINQQKMAKSLGNFISVKDFLKENVPDILKIFFLSAHYRKPIDFNEDRINEAKKSYERFRIFFDKAERKIGRKKRIFQQTETDKNISKFKKCFEETMDDDFNTPQALACLFDLVSFGNKLLADYKESYSQTLQDALELIRDCAKVFGISFNQVRKKEISKTEIEELIKVRNEYRKKRKFVEADKVRDRLEKEGIILEDTKEGTVWRRKV